MLNPINVVLLVAPPRCWSLKGCPKRGEDGPFLALLGLKTWKGKAGVLTHLDQQGQGTESTFFSCGLSPCLPSSSPHPTPMSPHSCSHHFRGLETIHLAVTVLHPGQLLRAPPSGKGVLLCPKLTLSHDGRTRRFLKYCKDTSHLLTTSQLI